MEIAFATKSLRQLCESEDTAKRSLGAKVAEKLKRRLADIHAASSAKDLVAGRPQKLGGNRGHKIAVDLCDGVRLVFRVNHNSIPRTEDGYVDWSKVSRVKILSIGNSHG